MKDFKKRVFMELLAKPATVVPFTIGVSLLMLSPVLGAGWGLLGFISCLGGAGMMGTNYVWNGNTIASKVIEDIQKEDKAARDVRLDALDTVLASNREPRDQSALRNMRTLYDDFMDDLKAGRINAAGAAPMLDKIEAIFTCCVSRLERQHQLWLTSCKVNGEVKTKLIKQRDDILDEVEKSVEGMASFMSDIRALGLKATSGELKELSSQLSQQLEIAKATDEAMREIEGGDMARFAEYQNIR